MKITQPQATFYLSGLSGPSSQFLNGAHEFSVGQSAGIWRVVAGKMYIGVFHLNWPEPVLFGRPERTNLPKDKDHSQQKKQSVDFVVFIP